MATISSDDAARRLGPFVLRWWFNRRRSQMTEQQQREVTTQELVQSILNQGASADDVAALRADLDQEFP